MKSYPSKQTPKNPMSKKLILGAALFAAAAATSTANITFDLRATGPGASADGRFVTTTPGASDIQLQIWAQITNAAPTNNIFGVQVILGSIKTDLNTASATGSILPITPAGPFGVQATLGASAELTVPADGILDLGSNATVVNTSFIKPRKDAVSGGEQVSAVFFATNNNSAGATVQPVANGFEFLMGTTTLHLTDFVNTSGTVHLNWAIPAFTTAANKGQIAQWTDADNLVNNGNQTADMLIGPGVIIMVPEPSAFGMVLLGAMGLVGFRRLGVRRA